MHLAYLVKACMLEPLFFYGRWGERQNKSGDALSDLSRFLPQWWLENQD
jgi:hypothetical protein